MIQLDIGKSSVSRPLVIKACLEGQVHIHDEDVAGRSIVAVSV